MRSSARWSTSVSAPSSRPGHIPGAINVELGSLAQTPLPEGPVTVMCGHGERAMTGASILTARNHRDVSVLDGGPDAWAKR